MKKIFLTLLFLFLTSVSTDAFAACEDTTGALVCTARTTASSCSGSSGALNDLVAAADAGTGCVWGGGDESCTGAAKDCNLIISNSVCGNTPGCQFLVTANADDNALVTVLCNALSIVQGNGGKAFAAFAIISVGIGFFTGKVSWGLMIGVTAGIAAMFGATSIVGAISGKEVIDCGVGTTSL
ncbi:MAG: type IV secretory pathway VirB2 component (pilin) [Myxococcota bacterium]|jgi:type IV secretory pathway VirB2 component (pilin)